MVIPMENESSRELFPRIEKKKVFEDIAVLIRDLIDAGTLNPAINCLPSASWQIGWASAAPRSGRQSERLKW